MMSDVVDFPSPNVRDVRTPRGVRGPAHYVPPDLFCLSLGRPIRLRRECPHPRHVESEQQCGSSMIVLLAPDGPIMSPRLCVRQLPEGRPYRWAIFGRVGFDLFLRRFFPVFFFFYLCRKRLRRLAPWFTISRRNDTGGQGRCQCHSLTCLLSLPPLAISYFGL